MWRACVPGLGWNDDDATSVICSPLPLGQFPRDERDDRFEVRALICDLRGGTEHLTSLSSVGVADVPLRLGGQDGAAAGG